MTFRPRIDLTLLAVTILSASICSCARAAKPAAQGNTPGSGAPLKIAMAEHLPPMPPPSKEKPLLVVYPRGSEIPASTSFVCGATMPGYKLTINGAEVPTNKQGFFAHMVSLKQGKNVFTVQATAPDGTVTTQSVDAVREKPPAIMSEAGLAIDAASAKPRDDQARTTGDIIELSCRATPHSKVSATIGTHTVPMVCLADLAPAARKKGAPTAKFTNVNAGLSAAYGQVYQRYPAHRPDFYVGLYKVQPEDAFVDASLTFQAEKGTQKTFLNGAAKITTIKQPIMARTIENDTIVRTAPDAGRLTPLPAQVRLMVDGWDGENIRCLYRAGKHGWIKKDALQMEAGGGPAPSAVARTIIVKKDPYGEFVSIPLSQRLPFTIEQSVKPNRLILRIYGVSGDTDWTYQAPQEDDIGQLVDNVTWKQPDDGTYEVAIDLKSSRQWGFFAAYGDGENENTLNLHVKNAPRLQPYTAGDGVAGSPKGGKLAGLKICVDPGHGGAELGAIGLSGIREAQVNFGIAQKFKTQLQKEGATVYMTREDDSDVSLDDRVKFARDHGVDLLISVHNNALPDGRDPIKEHGTSTYYYHPQAKELAMQLKTSMATGLGLKPLTTLYSNLALCRPSGMQAVLVEVGFMVNPDEYALLIDENFQQRAATALKDGLITYFGRD